MKHFVVAITVILDLISLVTFIPCHLDIALRGRKALKVLKDLKAVRLELPSTARLRTDT